MRLTASSAQPLLGDGAMATMLFQAGLAPDEPPERWTIQHPDRVVAVHAAYVAAGADLLLTNSFGGNRSRLDRHGWADRVVDVNRTAAMLARRVAAGAARPILVAGCVGPTGAFGRRADPLPEPAVTEIFAAQMTVLADGGVDLLWIETMSASDEMRAAALAACRVGLPFVLTASFDTGSRTLTGLDPAGFAALVSELPTAPLAIGANCGIGPAATLATLTALVAASPGLPIVAKPNAGLPARAGGGGWVYPLTPADLAHFASAAVRAGATILGGCCGTTPAHIAAMRQALDRPGA